MQVQTKNFGGKLRDGNKLYQLPQLAPSDHLERKQKTYELNETQQTMRSHKLYDLLH